MKMNRYIALIIGLLFLSNSGIHAQMRVISVSPHNLSSDITEVHSPHVALYNPEVQSRHKLILMIQGTGGSATDMHTMDSIFTDMGYHVISLDYKNNVISTVCEHSKDSTCSYDFRKEIITGKSLSDKTKVDSANSILNRLNTFLQYLIRKDPQGKWDRYFKKGKPIWKKIIVAGHSQGSGHAAMLGKMFKVNRVLIFSGPQDYLIDLKRPSPWLSRKSATPEKRYYAFLNLKDPFNAEYQIANCKKIMHAIHPDTLMVQAGEKIQGNHHILINDISTKDHHGSTLFPEFKNVWAYMLGLKK